MSRSARLVGLFALAIAGLSPSIATATPDQLTLVSRGYDGRPGTGPWWVSDSTATSISADGRRVAFISSATNMWQGAPLGEREVYVRDFAGTGLVPVSRADGIDGALADNNQLSWGGGITPDGRHVIFTANLHDTDDPAGLFGYRRDLTDNRTTIVTADDHDRPVSIWPPSSWPTPVGNRHVLFQTDNAVIDAVGAVPNGVYLRDLDVGRSVLVSRATGHAGAPADVTVAGTSPGGRYVTFASASGALAGGPEASNPAGGGFLYLRDLRLGQTILVSRVNGRASAPIATRTFGGGQVRGDGCQVVFSATGTDVAAGSPANGGLQAYLRDVCRDTTLLVSRADGDGDAATTQAPTGPLPPFDLSGVVMSADGRYVLFATAPRNVGDGAGRSRELYLRDITGKRTMLISRADGPDGAPSGGAAGGEAMTPDAKYVVFTSNSTVLAPGIVNSITQVFRRELGSVPPAPQPVQTCGAIDDPGIGGAPVSPCPSSGDDGSGGTPGGGLPVTPQPITVTVPGATPAASGPAAPAPDAPAVVSVPTLVRAPTLSAVATTAATVRAWVDLPATVQVAVARQNGRRWQSVRTLKVTSAKAGRVSVKLPRLTRARYRLTVRALGASGTKSPAIVRTVDLRPRKTQRR